MNDKHLGLKKKFVAYLLNSYNPYVLGRKVGYRAHQSIRHGRIV